MVLLLDQFYQQREKIEEPIQKKQVYSRLFSVLVHFHQRQFSNKKVTPDVVREIEETLSAPVQQLHRPHQPQRQMFPTPLQRVKLTQVLLLRLEQLIHQVNKRLDRVTLLVLVVVLVLWGLKDQVGDTDTNV